MKIILLILLAAFLVTLVVLFAVYILPLLLFGAVLAGLLKGFADIT